MDEHAKHLQEMNCHFQGWTVNDLLKLHKVLPDMLRDRARAARSEIARHTAVEQAVVKHLESL